MRRATARASMIRGSPRVTSARRRPRSSAWPASRAPSPARGAGPDRRAARAAAPRGGSPRPRSARARRDRLRTRTTLAIRSNCSSGPTLIASRSAGPGGPLRPAPRRGSRIRSTSRWRMSSSSPAPCTSSSRSPNVMPSGPPNTRATATAPPNIAAELPRQIVEPAHVEPAQPLPHSSSAAATTRIAGAVAEAHAQRAREPGQRVPGAVELGGTAPRRSRSEPSSNATSGSAAISARAVRPRRQSSSAATGSPRRRGGTRTRPAA